MGDQLRRESDRQPPDRAAAPPEPVPAPSPVEVGGLASAVGNATFASLMRGSREGAASLARVAGGRGNPSLQRLVADLRRPGGALVARQTPPPSAGGTAADRVLEALTQADPVAGVVSDYPQAFRILNGLSMAGILETLGELRRLARFDDLRDNFAQATGVNQPRLLVALRAVEQRGRTDPARFAADFAAELGTLPEDQRQEIAAYLGPAAPAQAAQPAQPAQAQQQQQQQLALSDAGVDFIGREEGFVATLYNDVAGHCTIGFGHLVHHGACNGTEPAEFRAAGGITRERALALLRADAANAEAAINDAVDVPLNQAQFDALVSFTFNVGTGAFRGSTLLRNLNNGQYDTVPEQMNRWVRAGGRRVAGLANRRAREGALFRDGQY